MTEVEKMYENAGVEPYRLCNNCVDDNGNMITDPKNCPLRSVCCNTCDKPYYEFTAEKQLELIKWLSTKELKIRTNKQPYAVYVGVLGNDNTCFYGCEGLYLEQTLSELINALWQDLTEEERKQITEILR